MLNLQKKKKDRSFSVLGNFPALGRWSQKSQVFKVLVSSRPVWAVKALSQKQSRGCRRQGRWGRVRGWEGKSLWRISWRI